MACINTLAKVIKIIQTSTGNLEVNSIDNPTHFNIDENQRVSDCKDLDNLIAYAKVHGWII